MRRLVIVTAALVALAAIPGRAYMRFGLPVNGNTVVLRWPAAVAYRVSDAEAAAGVSVAQFDQAITRAVGTWEAVSTADVHFTRQGFTSARPSDDDTSNVFGFVRRPDLDRTLAVTTYTIDTVNGKIVEADIEFNAAQPWSVAEAGSTLVLADDTLAVAKHAALHGWIASDALDEIGGEKREDEGVTGSKSDAPGVDTTRTPTVVVDPDITSTDVT